MSVETSHRVKCDAPDCAAYTTNPDDFAHYAVTVNLPDGGVSSTDAHFCADHQKGVWRWMKKRSLVSAPTQFRVITPTEQPAKKES